MQVKSLLIGWGSMPLLDFQKLLTKALRACFILTLAAKKPLLPQLSYYLLDLLFLFLDFSPSPCDGFVNF